MATASLQVLAHTISHLTQKRVLDHIIYIYIIYHIYHISHLSHISYIMYLIYHVSHISCISYITYIYIIYLIYIHVSHILLCRFIDVFGCPRCPVGSESVGASNGSAARRPCPSAARAAPRSCDACGGGHRRSLCCRSPHGPHAPREHSNHTKYGIHIISYTRLYKIEGYI